MKYQLTNDQKIFFDKYHFIEFEDFFPEHTIQIVESEIQKIIKKRKQEISATHDSRKKIELYRDIFRENRKVQQLLLNRNVTEIVSALMLQKALRYGFDYYLHLPQCTDYIDASLFTADHMSYHEVSAIRPLVCLIGICLKSTQSDETTKEKSTAFHLTNRRGNITIIHAKVPLNQKEMLYSNIDGHYLVLAVAEKRAQYFFEEYDPLSHFLMKDGYVYGDMLKDVTHPTLR